jgi:DNA-directed RNA polymerase subunit omega
MARVTVEDCVEQVPNRFDLVMVAAQRSRDISAGATLTLDRDNDKNPVVALREIAEETVEIDSLQDAVIRGLQKHVEFDEPEEDMLDLMSSDERLGALAADVGDEFGQAPPEETPSAVEVVSEAAPEESPEESPDGQPEVPDADQATEPE